MRNGHTLKVAGQQFAGNQTKAVLETIATLPLSLRQNKSVMLLRVRCAGAAGGKDYEDAMDDFAALFPNDPAANMLLMDGYALKKQYDKAIRAIDSVEQCVGGDAWLKRLRGNLFAVSDRLDLAIAEYRKAVAEEPDLKAAYWAWVNVTLTQKDFKETVRVLGEIEDRFDIRNREFPGVPMFADFVKSEEFKTWLARKKTTPVAKP